MTHLYTWTLIISQQHGIQIKQIAIFFYLINSDPSATQKQLARVS